MLGLDELYVVTGDKDLVREEEYNMDELLSKRWIFREEGSGTREVFLYYMEKETLATGTGGDHW